MRTKIFDLKLFQEKMRDAPPRGPQGSPQNRERALHAAKIAKDCWIKREEVKP